MGFTMWRSHKLYGGRTECSQSDPASKLRATTKLERVIVDCKEFYINVDSRPPQFIAGLKTFSIQTKDYLNLTDEQLLICGSRIPTYFLIPKHWRIIDVTGLRDVTFNTYAFDRLVIPQEQKDLISSLIPPPGVETAPLDDLIEGKGIELGSIYRWKIDILEIDNL
ncbi:uncharacterized protein K444DRAFT_303930 [Hyaloscypha bicolor E]|uniref:Uncharacterized protein n=1 Tax=Hyaloscypha bicolor E TaxID=1095630 RepID=A0A2J6TN95_9HELO|nr:uncharacterized protein K444DRAFT_303930 [Hyaloscypha bicolor E]PMD64428.1 hypothetical protein K444DRAFT_303930 [Hyaloscypha bicolor E]